ncbi:hypothetical protein K432DRAFT_416056 [Lepidopterella palustris CBS 459.81]|uniref:Uncharacterized protein n=1 Tax=Lepidopterella palustris CBS 459.81 TaxID=1314670 RepID=A0A8E2JG77_9PEZI|nr:hypothetical protein K432DRAFT_416056 [Lepidopterella palustris CBS 459.81]
MDGFDVSTAPQAYLDIKWIPDLFAAMMGLGWSINYIGMVQASFRDHTYGMAIIPLCNNIGWEIVYVFVHPSKSIVERTAFFTGLSLNVGVMYAAIRFSPAEWGHAPLVEKNLLSIFLVGIIACFTGHLALAAEIGPSLAYSWGAVICQILLSVGGLGQLLARNDTRGGSYTLWLGRFLGSCCTVVFASIRYLYWPEAFSWLASPLLMWSLAAFFLADTTYGVCFYLIKESESQGSKRN